VTELLAWIRSNSDKAVYGHAGIGLRLASLHADADERARVQMNGIPIAVRTRHERLLSNQFDLMCDRPPAHHQIKEGKIKGFAVTTKPGSSSC